MRRKRYSFQPDYAVPPGATLKETLESLGLSQADLAIRTGLAEKTISQIVNGIAPVSFETAEKLELATGVPATFWNRRELRYREFLARAEETEALEADVAWLKEVPVQELLDRKCIQPQETKVGLVREVLRFFGVSNVSAWRDTWLAPDGQYRGLQAQQNHPGFVAAWLRIGEIEARRIGCEPFDAREFKDALSDIRSLTTKRASTWQTELTARCAAAGVACFLVPGIPRAQLSGVTRWLTKDKALIQLSLKYKSDDQMWFTFFHEAGHILLHSKRAVFYKYNRKSSTVEDKEADVFARNFLIPPQVAIHLPGLRSKQAILAFARQLGIAPGIVVGRLQRDRYLPPTHCNDLKVHLEWA